MTPELALNDLHRLIAPPPTLVYALLGRDLNAELEKFFDLADRVLGQMADVYDNACVAADNGDDASAVVTSVWDDACQLMAGWQELVTPAQSTVWGWLFLRPLIAAIMARMDRLAELMRTMAVVWPELELETPDNITKAVWTVTITPGAYLRAMGNVFWSAIRHPLSETTIELKTGRVLHHNSTEPPPCPASRPHPRNRPHSDRNRAQPQRPRLDPSGPGGSGKPVTP